MAMLHNSLMPVFLLFQGEVIADFMQYFFNTGYSDKDWGDTRIHCILVDNTRCKCESAAGSI